MRVLLVEDTEPQALRIKALLAKLPLDLEVLWETKLSAALAAAGNVDRVLLDLTLDDSLGLETLDRFRAARPSVPVIVLSAEEDELIRAGALEKGAKAYLCKMGLDAAKLAGALEI